MDIKEKSDTGGFNTSLNEYDLRYMVMTDGIGGIAITVINADNRVIIGVNHSKSDNNASLSAILERELRIALIKFKLNDNSFYMGTISIEPQLPMYAINAPVRIWSAPPAGGGEAYGIDASGKWVEIERCESGDE